MYPMKVPSLQTIPERADGDVGLRGRKTERAVAFTEDWRPDILVTDE
jgi:hypothetical protein